MPKNVLCHILIIIVMIIVFIFWVNIMIIVIIYYYICELHASMGSGEPIVIDAY